MNNLQRRLGPLFFFACIFISLAFVVLVNMAKTRLLIRPYVVATSIMAIAAALFQPSWSFYTVDQHNEDSHPNRCAVSYVVRNTIGICTVSQASRILAARDPTGPLAILALWAGVYAFKVAAYHYRRLR